ncbi:MAG: threonine--tRNA ligase [Candidatus Caenarcaniphilales bacterium]|nr:threonine--tRNA ligase [Candidatus Caenarcaniphilales bacterium]
MSEISVRLPDNSIKKLNEGSTGQDLAKSIGERLFKDSVGLNVNDEYVDLKTELKDGDKVKIITKKDSDSLEFLRHSTAHILAAAVQNLYPQAKIAIGPTIQDGFYYDFYIPGINLSADDLTKIELEMQKLIDSSVDFVRLKVETPDIQINDFLKQGEKFKAELLEKYKNESPTQYGLFDGENTMIWSDLCRGPHIPNSKFIKAFKLLSVSSAYWQADETKESLQRVYGTAWWSKKDLDEYLHKIEEAEKRDHRKLSRQHELFSTHEDAGPGLIFWHPKLSFLRARIEEFWKDLHEFNGYELIYTPHIARRELWDTSGHTEFYEENMFQMKPIDEQEYILKPMNCPFHVLIFNSRRHSYRELPIRYAEMGTVYRFERSGALHGLARVRGFTQDDAHVFCAPVQLVDEVCSIIDLIDQTYSKFDLEYSAELSTRPSERIGDDSIWDMAEDSLKKALDEKQLNYELNEGDGAFYGPKIDFKLKDALGRSWQGATIQVDFNLPNRFDLKYTTHEGTTEKPVMLHRAIFGSLERFTALLIEHYSGAFPFWLCQTQVAMLPIADRHNEYCHKISQTLREFKIRAKVDERAEKVNAKIRDAQLEQVPYMIIIGDKELETEQVSVRERRKGDLGTMSISDLLKKIETEKFSR